VIELEIIANGTWYRTEKADFANVLYTVCIFGKKASKKSNTSCSIQYISYLRFFDEKKGGWRPQKTAPALLLFVPNKVVLEDFLSSRTCYDVVEE
jgi:hypothetical protein